MSNFYLDDPDLQHQLETLDLRRIVALREDGYEQAADFSYAPRDYEDALDSYRRTLEIVGDIAGEFVAPRAEDVDRAGALLADGEVCYAPGMQESLDRLTQADLMGITLPRRYGGLNFPVTVSVMIVEMISRADPALMNVFGLQDIAETVNKFAADEIKQAYLPRFASGEVTGSMALTEPEAGSDLQNVQLKATLGADGVWRLSGVKRFITNGCGEVSLVLARSEEGTTDARGLSMFLYERDEHMKIRRLEDKLGIHGSPTCELQFDGAPALLVGERRRGLTTYVMSLMNGARIAIAAQAQGIAEAAYRAASKYADERVQFGGPIRELTAVAAMLADMKVAVEASRALLYETAMIVDLKEGLERRIDQLQSGERAAAGQRRAEGAARRAQDDDPARGAVHAARQGLLDRDGQPGRLRLAADPRRLGVHARLRRRAPRPRRTHHEHLRGHDPAAGRGRAPGVLSGTLAARLDEYDAADLGATPELLARVRRGREAWSAAVAHVRAADDTHFRDFHGRRLVEAAIDLICAYLLLRAAQHDARKLLVARYFVEQMGARVEGAAQAVLDSAPAAIDTLQALGRD